jgi:hypothetical protein
MNTQINNGFIQPIMPEDRRTRDWQYRAWSNHLGADESFTLLTHGAAVYWLWVIDEIHRGRQNRNRARD